MISFQISDSFPSFVAGIFRIELSQEGVNLKIHFHSAVESQDIRDFDDECFEFLFEVPKLADSTQEFLQPVIRLE